RYDLQRTLRTGGNRLLADYCLQNDDSERLDWAWAQHPLLAVDERTRLVLPAPAPVRVGSAFADGTPSSDIGWLSPSGKLARETELTGARGHAAKIWFEAPHPTSIGVLHGEEWLLWRTVDAPDLGVWINLSGWGPQPLAHLAIEPAFGSSDDPEIAYAQSSSAGGWSLPGGARRSWRVTIEAGRGRDALATAMASG
ncbi:MAG: hypothetical protein ABR604_03730, partial [Jatrophihabitantaceae bacterium]